MKKILIALFLCLIASCQESGTDEAKIFKIVEAQGDGPVSFSTLKSEVLVPFGCINCHGDWAQDEDSIRSRLTPGDPFSSPLYLRVEDQSMPLNGAPVDNARLKLIEQYIEELVVDASDNIDELTPIEPIEEPVSPQPEPPVKTKVSYTDIKEQLLTPFNCLQCHGSWMASEEKLRSRITPGDPLNSPLYQRVMDGTMPPFGPAVDSETTELLFEYIQEMTE